MPLARDSEEKALNALQRLLEDDVEAKSKKDAAGENSSNKDKPDEQ